MSAGNSATLDVQSIGGTGGSLTEKRFSGHRLTGIQAWAENHGNQKIRGLRIWMTSGSTETVMTFGREVGTASSRFTLAVTETISSLQLWDNGSREANGTRLGTIAMRLNTGRSFTFGINRTQQAPRTVQVNVGSGICVGYRIRSSLDIDALGFEFLRPVLTSEITDVRFPDLGNLAALPPTDLDGFSQTNESPLPNNWSWSGSQTRTISSEWSFDAALVIGASVRVTAGIPIIARVQSEFRWQVSAAFNQGVSTTTSRNLTWRSSGIVPPNRTVTVTAISGHGTIDTRYTAVMRITTQGGFVLNYPFEGKYKGVAWSNAEIIVSSGLQANIYADFSDRCITGLEDYGAADISISD